jgi:hypothetical protein
MRRSPFCYHHKRQREQRLELEADRVRNNRDVPFHPALEDADSIQVSLAQVMRLLAAGQIDRKTASLMLYSLQIATTNLQHTTFGPAGFSEAPRAPAPQLTPRSPRPHTEGS